MIGILSPVKVYTLIVYLKCEFFQTIFFLSFTYNDIKKSTQFIPRINVVNQFISYFFVEHSLIITGYDWVWRIVCDFSVKNVIKIYCLKQYNLRLIHPLTYRDGSYRKLPRQNKQHKNIIFGLLGANKSLKFTSESYFPIDWD